MKSTLYLSHYLMTWLRPLVWLVWLGLGLACVAVLAGILGWKQFAFGLAIYAFVPLLALPYLLAWFPFRVMLSSRRLALLPGFRLRLGLALLLTTLLLSLFLPLASLLFWPGVVPLPVAHALFLAASLFTLAMQWAIASPYSMQIFSLGPFLVIYAVIKTAPLLLLAFTRVESLMALTLVGALGWGLALHKLNSQRNFQPPLKAPLHARDYVWDGRSDLLGILFGNYKGPVKSAEGTLLAGMPDGFSGRFFSLVYLVLVSPLMGVLLLHVTGLAAASGSSPVNLVNMFLAFSLTTVFVFGFSSGESVARYRLLWLRLGGSRAGYWQSLDQRVLADTGLLALIVIPITGVTLMLFDTPTFHPLAYGVLALAGKVLSNYFSLAARLSQWSLLLQLLLALSMAAGLVTSHVLEVLPLPAIVLLMLGLALLFRHLAHTRFVSVDWARLRPNGARLVRTS